MAPPQAATAPPLTTYGGVMAILHRATLTPTKTELLAGWLPQQEWYDGVPDAQPRPLATFRLDDPDGDVGIESVLALTAGGGVWQLAMTYRAEPLDGGAEHLIGTLEHSVLGTRYVYDAVGDPVFLDVLRTTIATSGTQAELVRDLGDGTSELVESSMTARGTGGDGVDAILERRPEPAVEADLAAGSGALIGERPGEPPVVLARLL